MDRQPLRRSPSPPTPNAGGCRQSPDQRRRPPVRALSRNRREPRAPEKILLCLPRFQAQTTIQVFPEEDWVGLFPRLDLDADGEPPILNPKVEEIRDSLIMKAPNVRPVVGNFSLSVTSFVNLPYLAEAADGRKNVLLVPAKDGPVVEPDPHLV